MPEEQNTFTVLIVDDEQEVLNSLKHYLSRKGYRILLAVNGEEALETIRRERIDLVLLDLYMPGMSGMEVLEKARDMVSDLQVIIQTGRGGVEEAVQAIRKGAADFLVKGDSVQILNNRIRLIHEKWKLVQRYMELKQKHPFDTFRFDKFIGESPTIVRLKTLITRVAPTDTTVLIQGESGTGKELIAQALHFHSDRQHRPFVAVDCASISESLIEAELFGHEKGSFTGATVATQGLIRAAHTGTLFLDELGEISQKVQAKLLRVLQERIVRPVGSTKNHPVDVRVIAATNRNLYDEVRRSAFRQDLYYRLSSVTLVSPPLRERGEDIMLLAEHFLVQCEAASGRKITLSPEARDLLSRYSWPGNVRELDNVIRGAVIYSDDGIIRPENLPIFLCAEQETAGIRLNPASMAASEKETIQNALITTNGHRKKAAAILGISEATLYRKLKKYNLR